MGSNISSSDVFLPPPDIQSGVAKSSDLPPHPPTAQVYNNPSTTLPPPSVYGTAPINPQHPSLWQPEKKSSKKLLFVLGSIALVLSLAVGALTIGFTKWSSAQYDESLTVLLDDISTSESKMMEWNNFTESLYVELTTQCSISEEACKNYWDSYDQDKLSELARTVSNDLIKYSRFFRNDPSRPVSSWDTLIIAARDDYLKHNQAWTDMLSAVALNPYNAVDEIMEGATPTYAEAQINPTFLQACLSMSKAAESGTPAHVERVSAICNDPTEPLI